MNETEALLTSAFWQLLEEKPYKKITVRDIVDRCQVNRNTFYYHFEGIPSLLVRVLSIWSEELLSDTRLIEAPLLSLLPLADVCREHRKAILNLKNSRAWEEVMLPVFEAYCTRAARLYVQRALPQGTAKDRSLLTRFYRASLYGCALDWINSGMEGSLSEDILQILRLTNQLPETLRNIIPVPREA